MNIFLSWSDSSSYQVAKAFREWLPSIFNTAKFFFSPDIEKGSRPLEVMANELSTSNFGIVFLTPENLGSTWIHFESGALSKLKDENRLWTFLFELKPTDVVAPLSQFQHTLNEKDEIYKLVSSINEHSETKLETNLLRRIFEKWWPELEADLQKTAKSSSMGTVKKNLRSERDLIEEVLERLRSMERQLKIAKYPKPIIRIGHSSPRFSRVDSSPRIDSIISASIEFVGEHGTRDAMRVRDRVNELLPDDQYIFSLETAHNGAVAQWSFPMGYSASEFGAIVSLINDEGFVPEIGTYSFTYDES